MAIINKNIWTLYYLIVFIGTLLLSGAISNKYLSLSNMAENESLYLNRIFKGNIESLLSQQETLLNLIGPKLIKGDSNTVELLDNILTSNKLLVGFAVFKPNGELITASSNIDPTKVPNFLTFHKTKKWFKKTLESKNLTIGETYYFKATQKWAIPIRKRITDSNGKVIAVVTTGLDLNTLQNQWHEDSAEPKILQFTLDSSYFRSFRSNTSISNYTKTYSTPIPHKQINYLDDLLFQNHSQRLDSLRKTEKPYTLLAKTLNGSNYLTLSFIKKYQVWTTSSISHKPLIKKVLHFSFIYTSFYIILLTGLFMMFRWVRKNEIHKLKELTFRAEHDALTGLYNRSYIPKHFKKIQESGVQKFYLLYLDLDNFKTINDSFGHSFGDIILKEVAIRILKGLREENDLVVRHSGDEFILFIEAENDENVSAFAKKIISKISKPFIIENNEFQISGSIGIANYPDDSQDIEMLVSYADNIMYVAKKSDQRFEFFSKENHSLLLRKMEIEYALNNAIENEEISMVYQPQVGREFELFGVEALVRWNSDKLGFIPPDVFIPIAEESGLMPKLGLYIMTRSIKEISEIQQNLNTHFNLSINVSVRQFIQVDFLDSLFEAYKQSQKEDLKVTVEITESLFIENLDALMPIFKKMKDNGIALSLDDFGTGYSSLSMLRDVPIDELKIDKSFIDHITDRENDKAMVESIISMGKNMGMTVLAEGVETKEHLEILHKSHCDLFQGYYFSRPLTPKDLVSFITEKR